VFSTRFVPRSYKEDSWGNQVSSVRESVKKRVSWKGGAIQEDLSGEAEESPLLEAVTSERLVKTQEAEKGLADAVVICEIVEINGDAVIICGS
jgi:hypothetical protein